MTSYCKLFVNTSCTNIIECYRSYPKVNTNLLTSRSLKGVDKSDGLHNKKSMSGRETVSLYPQLGTHHTGPMGPASHKWVFSGAYSNSTTNETASSYKMFDRGTCQNNTRGLRPPDKGGNCGNPGIHRQLCFPTIPGGEERGRTKASNKPQGPKLLHRGRALQDGRPAPSSGFDPASGLDGQARPEGRLPTGPNSPGQSMFPPIPVGTEDIPVCMSALWSDISTSSVYQDNEASSGGTATTGNSSYNILRRSTGNAPGQRPSDAAHHTVVPIPGNPGPDSELEEVTADPNSGNGIPGVPSQLSFSTVALPIRETEENPAGCTLPLKERHGVGQGLGKICGKSNGFSSGHMAGSTTLQSSAENGNLNCPTGPASGEQSFEVCLHAKPQSRSQGRPQLVGLPGQTPAPGFPNTSTDPGHDNRVRCLQHGLGSSAGRNADWGSLVNERGLKPYQLPRAVSSVSSSTVFCETEAQHYNPLEDGQRHCGDIHKQDGGHPIRGTLPSSPDHMELVSAAEHISDSRISPRGGEHSGRRRVQEYEGPLRLDVEPPHLQAGTGTDGAIGNRPVCV